jgi:iron-sulfur cluster assembly protein
MAITLTEPAADQIKQVMQSQSLDEGTMLRMSVAGGGCSGMQYGLDFETEYDPRVDARFDHHGVSLVTKKKYALYLDGTTIDFQDGPMGRGFAITNPNQPQGGCGSCGHH